MYSALIDKSVTFLFDNSISSEFNEMSMMGFLNNHSSIKELVSEISIDKFYVRDTTGKINEITEQQAHYLYDQILDYNLNKCELESKKLK